jgi:hypothetical protein
MDNQSFLAPVEFIGEVAAGQKIVCIDDKAKPEQIPNTHWVKEGELLYH